MLAFIKKNKWILIGLATLACIPFITSRYAIDLTIQIMIYALFALSLNVLVGYIGNISFGHAAFFAIGGYTCVILLTTFNLPFIISFLSALLVTAIVAFFVGLICIRLNQMYFAMLTLAFGMLVWAIALKWRPITGGDDGFVGINMPSNLDNPITLAASSGLLFIPSIASY